MIELLLLIIAVSFLILTALMSLGIYHFLKLCTYVQGIAKTDKDQMELYRNAVLPDILCDQVEHILHTKDEGE